MYALSQAGLSASFFKQSWKRNSSLVLQIKEPTFFPFKVTLTPIICGLEVICAGPSMIPELNIYNVDSTKHSGEKSLASKT